MIWGIEGILPIFWLWWECFTKMVNFSGAGENREEWTNGRHTLEVESAGLADSPPLAEQWGKGRNQIPLLGFYLEPLAERKSHFLRQGISRIGMGVGAHGFYFWHLKCVTAGHWSWNTKKAVGFMSIKIENINWFHQSRCDT